MAAWLQRGGADLTRTPSMEGLQRFHGSVAAKPLLLLAVQRWRCVGKGRYGSEARLHKFSLDPAAVAGFPV